MWQIRVVFESVFVRVCKRFKSRFLTIEGVLFYSLSTKIAVGGEFVEAMTLPLIDIR